MKGELALLLKALAFAAHKHRDQRRKDADASPYINHPIALADVLVNEGGVTDFEVLCAALLHVTVEDTATTHEELVDAFGSRIARIVAEVTDDKRLPKAERKRLQIEHAPKISHEAKLVKLADKLVNLRDGGFISAHDFHIGKTIAEVMCGGDVEPGTLVDEAWMLKLERKAFMGLLMHPKSQERIMGMMTDGKPVRN